jgi:hypothetical protein
MAAGKIYTFHDDFGGSYTFQRTAPKSGPHAPTLREGPRALTLACDVAEPPRYVEEPPLTRPVAPIHARGAMAYLHITSGSKLAS